MDATDKNKTVKRVLKAGNIIKIEGIPFKLCESVEVETSVGNMELLQNTLESLDQLSNEELKIRGIKFG